MALVDDMNAVSRNTMQRKLVHDLAFRRKSPFWDRMRKNSVEYKGGTFVRNTSLVGKTQGGAYFKGGTFVPVKTQLLDETQFTMKYYQQTDVQFLEEVEVENNPKSEAVVFTNFEIAQKALIMTMNEMLAVDVYNHGQDAGTGVATSRLASMNGFAEIYNDGVTSSWQGDNFPIYGNNTRNSGVMAENLNSIPFWCGDSSGNAGAITFNILLTNYLDCTQGSWYPDLMTGNKAVFGYIITRMQPQQRFGQEENPRYGFLGFKFMNAEFMVDEYAPSAIYGKNDPKTGNWLTSSFTSSASPASSSNLPASTTVTVGETLWIHTTPTFDLLLSPSQLYQYGWTGYKTAQVNTIVIGQLLFAGNPICYMVPYGKQLYGINS